MSLQLARRSHQSIWVFNFRRTLRAWKEDKLDRLLNFLGGGPVLRSDAVDYLCWKPMQSGVFKVNLVYAWGLVNDGPIQRPVELIWNNFSPLKVKFFSWLAWRGRLKTKELLHRLDILESNDVLRCIFCHKARESTEHIMLHCLFVWRIWSAITLWWGFQWAIPSSIEDLLLWRIGWKFKKKVNQIWRVLPTTIMWSVWRYSNDCVFNLVQPNLQDLCECIKVRVAIWMRSHYSGASFSVNDVVFNFKQVRRCIGST